MNAHDLYLRKSGDTFVDDANEFYFECEDWFFVVDPRDDALWLLQMAGNGKKLMERVEFIAKQNGYTHIKAVTQRPLKAIKRMYGFEPYGIAIQKEVGE